MRSFCWQAAKPDGAAVSNPKLVVAANVAKLVEQKRRIKTLMEANDYTGAGNYSRQ